MEGQPVARAVPAAAPWVYTLYTKDEGPFVHALNTEGFALCIDLPAAARSGPAAAREWGLALAPGDGVLYAANPALGLVVAIDADEGRILRTGRIPRGAIGAPPRLAVAPDGATLYVPSARRRRRRRHGDPVAARHAAARPSRQRRARARPAPLRPGRRGGDARRRQRPGAEPHARRPRPRRRSPRCCRFVGSPPALGAPRCANSITEERGPRSARPGRPGASVLLRCRRTTLSRATVLIFPARSRANQHLPAWPTPAEDDRARPRHPGSASPR